MTDITRKALGRDETYKYPGIQVADAIKNVEKKEKVYKGVLQKNKNNTTK